MPFLQDSSPSPFVVVSALLSPVFLRERVRFAGGLASSDFCLCFELATSCSIGSSMSSSEASLDDGWVGSMTAAFAETEVVRLRLGGIVYDGKMMPSVVHLNGGRG